PIEPIFAYNHSVGNCIVGGCIYRGQSVPELAGAYLFADYVTGHVYTLHSNERGQAVRVEQMRPISMPVFSFCEDEAREVYLTTTQGIINRVIARGAVPER